MAPHTAGLPERAMARIGYPQVCTFRPGQRPPTRAHRPGHRRPGTDPTAITRTGFALNATDAAREYGLTGNPAGP